MDIDIKNGPLKLVVGCDFTPEAGALVFVDESDALMFEYPEQF